jgi:hypothetical protein
MEKSILICIAAFWNLLVANRVIILMRAIPLIPGCRRHGQF